MHRTDSNVAAPAAARASARRDALAARALGAARAANRRIRESPRHPALDSRAMSPVSPLERTDGARALESVTASAIDDALADAALDAGGGGTTEERPRVTTGRSARASSATARASGRPGAGAGSSRMRCDW